MIPDLSKVVQVATCIRKAPHMCMVNGPCNGWPKPFPPTPHKIVTIIINEHGDNVFLKTDSADCFLECGETITRRASHVEPFGFWLRTAFTLLRSISADDSIIAKWTRTWNTLWRVNTKPVGGPILTWADIWSAKGTFAILPWVVGLSQYNYIACFSSRQAAIDMEIVFLNNFFAERTI
jgi:hypothetical protein